MIMIIIINEEWSPLHPGRSSLPHHDNTIMEDGMVRLGSLGFGEMIMNLYRINKECVVGLGALVSVGRRVLVRIWLRGHRHVVGAGVL